jgi:transposase-like protein
MVIKQKLQAALHQVRQSYHDDIAAEIQNSTKTYSEIAKEYGVSQQTVYQVARLRGLCRSSQQSDAEQVNPGVVSLKGGNHGQF